LKRYLTSAVEQALWSILNLGVNLLLIRLTAPEQYGAFAFWANTAFVFTAIMNALAVVHLQVSHGDGLSEPRRSMERLMHAVTLIFLGVSAAAVTSAALVLKQRGLAIGAPAAALFVAAFCAQQYVRALAFSRGAPKTAMLQTGAVLVLAMILLTAGQALASPLSANMVLTLMGAAYGVVAVAGYARATRGQGPAAFAALGGYGAYATQSGWVFLGVTTTEVLTRFYAFVVAGAHGAAALAALTATQLLLRPIPLLASSWGMVARNDLVRRRDSGDWRGFRLIIGLALAGGLAVSLLWTGAIYLAWTTICRLLFHDKYAGDGWMVLLWGLSALFNFCQLAIGSGLQVLKLFKPLALANLAASSAAVAAILIAMNLWGPGGAIAGTAVGQGLELIVMGVLLARGLKAAKDEQDNRRAA
jgi:O-antigen/teichoic acid export membrane protein